MNKRLRYTFSACMLVAAALGHAQEGVSYGYCSDEIEGCGFTVDGKYWIAGAFKMTDADVSQFDGCEITGVSIGFGSGRNKDIKIFMTEDLASEPFYTQAGRVRASQWCDIPVTEPVKIEKGKPFYIGYTYYVDNMTAKPIGTDGNTLSYTDGADWMAAAMTEEELSSQWKQYGKEVGNICIRAIINGENLSKANCVPVALDMPELATPGEPFKFSLSFTNASSVPVSNVEVVYQLGSDAEQTIQYDLPQPVATNARGEIEIDGLTDQDELEIPSWARITKVNGLPNDMADRKAYGTLVCTTGLFERKMVVEKFSGVHCGYCPRGIVGFDYMNEHHKDAFIGISVQNYSASDPMYCTAYEPWKKKFSAGGAPYCYVNRNKMLTTNPEKGTLEDAFNTVHYRTSNIGIKVTAEATADPMAYDVTGTVKVARDVEDASLAMTFVVTEDFVGPYRQTNNFNTSPGCPEFSGKGNPVNMLFHDVARNIPSDWEGYANSVPQTLKAGEEYPFTVKALSPGRTSEPKNANIIALLIDTKTSEIINADRMHIDPSRDDNPGGIDAADGGEPRFIVTGGEGFIALDGDECEAQIYSVSGQLTAVIRTGETVEAAPGMYIVKTPAKAEKTIVR